MKRYAGVLAVLTIAVSSPMTFALTSGLASSESEWLSQAGTVRMRAQAGFGGVNSAARGFEGLKSGLQDTQEELKKAQAQLASLLEKINAKIAHETDRDRIIELYQWRDQVQAALDAVSNALGGGGEADKAKQARLEQALSEAKFLNKMLASYLGENDFAWTVHFKREAFEFEVGGDAVYEAILKRLPFLGGAVHGRFRVNPGAEMISQFNAAKAEYYTTLLEAAQALKDLGKSPFSDMRLKGMAAWGKDTNVIYPGKNWMAAQPVLTWEQYNSLE